MTGEIIIPENIAQAKKYLKQKFVPLAGGTTLLLNRSANQKLLDLSKLKLNYIKYQKKSISLGAMTTIGELLEEKKLENIFGGLIPKALLTIGSNLNRQMITVGGNIVGIHPWSVLPALFLLLNSRIKTIQKKIYPAEKFFATAPKSLLKNDLVSEVEIPLAWAKSIGRWEKLSLTATDYPLISVGVLPVEESIRIVTVGLSLLPQLFIIARKNIDKEIENIGEKVKISQDIRASIEYKREILKNILTDILQ